MTLFINYDKASGRYQLADSRHYANDLTKDEFFAFCAELNSGRFSADTLFEHVAERHQRARER